MTKKSQAAIVRKLSKAEVKKRFPGVKMSGNATMKVAGAGTSVKPIAPKAPTGASGAAQPPTTIAGMRAHVQQLMMERAKALQTIKQTEVLVNQISGAIDAYQSMLVVLGRQNGKIEAGAPAVPAAPVAAPVKKAAKRK